MKNKITLCLAGVFISLCSLSHAQQFWIENWTGTTCAQLCHTYTGPNGTWTIDSTSNGTYSNDWYFSYQEQGMGRGQCGTGKGTHATAHVGNVAGSPASILCPTGDCGASYDASNSATVVTNKRIKSPVINCSGRSGITLSFNYIMSGQIDIDNDSVEYFNGTSWAFLALPAMSVNTGCLGQGKWTYYSVALPASADNNPNVQIGFKWSNNGDGVGKDPSFAVDSIILSGAPSSPPPVTAFSVDDTIICAGDTIQLIDQSTNSPTNWAWTLTGGNPSFSSQQNPKVVYNTPGYYNVKLKSTNAGGSDSLTKTTYIDVVAPPSPSFSGKDTVCLGDSISITAKGGTTYAWQDGTTTATLTIMPDTTTTYCVSISNGICTKDTCRRVYVKVCEGIQNIEANSNISLYPNPADNSISLEFNSGINGNAKIDISDVTGRIISTRLLNSFSGKQITMDVSGLASGMYFVKISTPKSEYYAKFIRQ